MNPGKKINELGWEILPPPPYTPDIAPSDFHLLQLLQHFLCVTWKFGWYSKCHLEIFFSIPIDFVRSGIKNSHTRWQKIVDKECITTSIKNKNMLIFFLFNVKKTRFLSSPRFIKKIFFQKWIFYFLKVLLSKQNWCDFF